MAYNEALEQRIDRVLHEKGVRFESKKMMGGLCYMVDDKMCVGIIKEDLMARIGEKAYPKAISHPNCRPMDFTKRPMKGYVYVDPDGTDLEKDLAAWIQLALDFNPEAKSSKKKKKK